MSAGCIGQLGLDGPYPWQQHVLWAGNQLSSAHILPGRLDLLRWVRDYITRINAVNQLAQWLLRECIHALWVILRMLIYRNCWMTIVMNHSYKLQAYRYQHRYALHQVVICLEYTVWDCRGYQIPCNATATSDAYDALIDGSVAKLSNDTPADVSSSSASASATASAAGRRLTWLTSQPNLMVDLTISKCWHWASGVCHAQYI